MYQLIKRKLLHNVPTNKSRSAGVYDLIAFPLSRVCGGDIKHVEDDFCYMCFTKYDVDERAIKDYKILIKYL